MAWMRSKSRTASPAGASSCDISTRQRSETTCASAPGFRSTMSRSRARCARLEQSLAANDGAPVRRAATVVRETKETRVEVTLDLDGSGRSSATTGIGMLDHLVEQIGKHGLFDLSVTATGDLHVDEHHTVEDVGIALGQALDQALGQRPAIVPITDA